jgi:hypothetical protein
MTAGTFLLEAYLPNMCTGGAASTSARAHAAAEEMAGEGTSIRLLRLFFLPEDELCFCLYEARSIDAVAEAGRRAHMRFERIQPVVSLLPIADSCSSVQG